MTATNHPEKTILLHAIGKLLVREEEGRFEVHIDPPYRLAMVKLEEFSHVIVVWWADRNDKLKLREIMTVELPYARGVDAGVFACRSERRPNPICITTAPVLEIDHHKGIIRLPWIDALDQSPLLDLKPYIPTSDRVQDVRTAGWMAGWPLWMEEAEEYFTAHQTDFGG